MRKYLIILVLFLTSCSWSFWFPTTPYKTLSIQDQSFVIPPHNKIELAIESKKQELSVVHLESELPIKCNLTDQDCYNIVGDILSTNTSCILHLRTVNKTKMILHVTNLSDVNNEITFVSNMD